MSDNKDTAVPALSIKDLSFAYAASEGSPNPRNVLDNASLTVPEGSFCLLVGNTGSGKTTLLRLCKPEIAPAGRKSGDIYVFGRGVGELDVSSSAQLIGFVFQSPDNQIVCDSVWHEMSLGLENLGSEQGEMRRRVAETSYFFGMNSWFRQPTAQLSGGQRQILALAAALVMRPRLLLLDEPTSMLDPIAAKSFLSLLFRVNRELGCTIVVATHTPQPMADYATMAIRVVDGRTAPADLKDLRSETVLLPHSEQTPHLTVPPTSRETLLDLSDVWSRYSRTGDWVLRGCDLSIAKGEVRALVGGNGCGKSTLIGIIAGTCSTQRGKVRNRGARSQALLPQSPKALFVHEDVKHELMDWAPSCGYNGSAARAMLEEVGLSANEIWHRHPYDLSGGQQQLLALAKLLLTNPQLLLLDEPTKGLDLPARRTVVRIIHELAAKGTTVVVTSHDVPFVRVACDSVSMLFDGQIALTEPADTFFSKSWVWGSR